MEEHEEQAMKIFITGATGFIGRALVPRLLRDGHQLSCWVRDAARARASLGAEAELVSAEGGAQALRRAVAGADAVVHLAGENLFAGRWSAARKRALVASRVGLTEQLVAAIEASDARPRVLVSASAVGYYGDRGDEELDEQSAPGDDFLADLVQRWEAAALRAESLGLRVVLPRVGIVLGADGGALKRLLPLFRLGLGARLGSGRQQVSWIHLRDMVEVLVTALRDQRYSGAINAVAPAAVSNAELTAVLARVVQRPALLWAPALALRALLGEAADALLGGQRARPALLERLGFHFRHPELEGALRAVTWVDPALQIGRVTAAPPELSAVGRPQLLLQQETVVPAPLEEVFAYFSQAQNLGAITPADMAFQILGAPPEKMSQGTVIDYRIKLGPLPMRWRTVIDVWEQGRRFVDRQARGPYKLWWHEHSFVADGRETLMRDRVYFSAPLGPLGWIAQRLFIRGTLRRIFSYRAEMIALRFGGAPRAQRQVA